MSNDSEIENLEAEFGKVEMNSSRQRGPLPQPPPASLLATGGGVHGRRSYEPQTNISATAKQLHGSRRASEPVIQEQQQVRPLPYPSMSMKYSESPVVESARSARSAASSRSGSQQPLQLNRPETPDSTSSLQFNQTYYDQQQYTNNYSSHQGQGQAYPPQQYQYNQQYAGVDYNGSPQQPVQYAQYAQQQQPQQQYYVAPQQQIYYHGRPPSGPAQRRISAQDNTDTMSVHSATTSATSAIIPHENLEAYRQEIKKTKDPVKQFQFAKQLVLVAEEMRKNPQGLDPQKIRKNRDILHHEALKWIKKSAAATYNGKTGYPDALFYLADCYGNGNLGLTIDHERAFGYYTQGAKQDHPASVYRTGVCYEVGAGPKRDQQRAVQYYKKAAALGDPAAMFKIGMVLLEGTLGQSRNPKEGINLLKRAATQADETTPYALHELAILYEGTNLDPSTGIVPDPAYSFELFLKASKLGYAPSQYKLGLAHEYGHLGLAIDAKRSIAWFTKAAQQGEAEAELALSGWYLTGHEGVLNQSDKEAYLWARKAASKGLAKAEYAVGYFMEHGVGTEQNLEEARRWYIRSAGQGNPRAIARLSDKGQAKKEASQQIRPSDWRGSKDAQNGNCSVM